MSYVSSLSYRAHSSSVLCLACGHFIVYVPVDSVRYDELSLHLCSVIIETSKSLVSTATLLDVSSRLVR